MDIDLISGIFPEYDFEEYGKSYRMISKKTRCMVATLSYYKDIYSFDINFIDVMKKVKDRMNKANIPFNARGFY